jgi:lysozyme
MASYNTSGVTSYTDTSSIAGISAASGQDYSSGSSGLMSASSSRGRNRDADMYAGSKYAPTKNAGTAKAKQSFAATATSSDDDNGYTPTAIAAKFEAAGATLPPARNPMDRFRDTMASSLYDSDMFKPYVPDPTEEIETYLGNTAVEDALKEALGIDDTQRQTYQGIPTAEEPEPNIDMSVLQAALMPEPITVEELEVKAGDTLSAIAAENNLPVQDVIDANPQIKNPNLIRPGEKVKLPETAGTMNFTEGDVDTSNLQYVDVEDFDTTTMSFVEQNEGRKNTPYQDTKGLWTVGVGHLLGKTLPDEYKSSGGAPRTLTDQEVQDLFDADYNKHKAEAAQLPMFSELDAPGKQALIDLTFNMGPTKFNEKKWPKFFAALKNKDLDTAAKELKNSKWFNEVASRAPKVINLIKGASFN